MIEFKQTLKEFEQILKENEFVVVDFWAEWCPPCVASKPIVESVAMEYKDKAKFYKINIDEEQSVAQHYSIKSIPTILIFHNGSLKVNIVGVHGDFRTMLKTSIDDTIKAAELNK